MPRRRVSWGIQATKKGSPKANQSPVPKIRVSHTPENNNQNGKTKTRVQIPATLINDEPHRPSPTYLPRADVTSPPTQTRSTRRRRRSSVVQREPRYLLLVGIGGRPRYLLLLLGFHSEIDAADVFSIAFSVAWLCCRLGRLPMQWGPLQVHVVIYL